MLRTFTCIMCPQGCDITAVSRGEDDWDLQVSGNRCPKGLQYVRQEMENPMRSIATSILVEGGVLPLASVRLTAPIPKGRIFDVMAEIRMVKRRAPVYEGDVVISDVLGLGSDVIITKTVEKSLLVTE